MELFDRPDFKEGFNILKRYYNTEDIKNSIIQINEKEYRIGYIDMWENIFTFGELHILKCNNFLCKNNSIIYINH